MNRNILLLGGALVGSESLGITNFTQIGGSDEEEAEVPDVPSIGSGLPSIDLSGLGSSPKLDLGSLGDLGSSGEGLGSFDLGNLGDTSGIQGLVNSDPIPDIEPPQITPPEDIGSADDRITQSLRNNSDQVGDAVGSSIWNITGGVVGSFARTGVRNIQNQFGGAGREINSSDPTGNKESPEGQLEVANSILDQDQSISEGIQEGREAINENVKGKKDTSGGSSPDRSTDISSSSSSSSSSSGGSSPNFFSDAEPLRSEDEVKGKSESEVQADIGNDLLDTSGSSGNSSNTGKNKKKDKNPRESVIGVFQ